MRNYLLLSTVLLTAGCGDILSPSSGEKKSGPATVIGQTTQDIGEFDDKANVEISDSKIRATNPVTGALEAYRPMVEQITKSQIQHAIRLFEAENGQYPKDYEEFMSVIIKRNNIRLPKLPGEWQYQYDAANHELVVVKEAAANGEAAK